MKRRKVMALEIFNLLLFSHVFSLQFNTILTQETHGQAFIQTDNELKYVPDISHGMPLGEDLHKLRSSDKNNRPPDLTFDPPMLDFNEQPVGMPRMETVRVHNPDTINSLHLLSISGSTLHFHCSFFQDKMVAPGGNTSFEIVFLARQVGNVENTLYIHTSEGTFKYQVFGVGKPNPYRLRPFLGARVPINSSFSPLIHMHNPYSTALQVLEMYSTGGDLHLELPTGDKEASRNLWEILPYETKPVMRASFIGRRETNHTAFIRIKTSKEKDKVLVLPMEVEVTSLPGIFSTTELLDFGILRTHDGSKTLRLTLINSSKKPIHIQSISVSPPNEAVSIEFRPIKIQPDVIESTTIALVSFKASKAASPEQWSGNLIIKSKSNQYKLTVPYKVDVMHGALVYNASDVQFQSEKKTVKNFTKIVPLTNTFNFTIVIYNITLPQDAERYFTVVHYRYPVILRPLETVKSFRLKFHPNSTNIHYVTQIRMYSNCSVFHIPLIVYNGLLKVIHHTPPTFKDQLDFGTLGMEEKRSMTFTLRNDNPVDIIVEEYGASMHETTVTLLGIERGNGTTLTQKHNASTIDTNPLIIKPYHFAVFSVNIVAPDYEGAFAADITFKTKNGQWLHIPFTMRTAEGSLTSVPEKVIIDDAFPGKIARSILKIHSSFDGFMDLVDIFFTPPDDRFYYAKPNKKRVEIDLGDNIVGDLFFDARKQCKEDCYVGLPTSTTLGHQWIFGLSLSKEVADTDQYLYTKFRQKWEHLVATQQTIVNVTVNLDTDAFRGFLFPAQAHLHWPSVASTRLGPRFPLTQIGNSSTLSFDLDNPGDSPIIYQVLTLAQYPNPQMILELLKSRLQFNQRDLIEMDDTEIFPIISLSLYTKRNESLARWRELSENYGFVIHPNTFVAVINGGQSVRIQIGFQPKDDIPRSTLVVVRNNLTIIDAIVIQGQGAYGELKLSSRKPGSTSPLLFDITEKVLKSCEVDSNKKGYSPSFTVMRSFTLRNTGSLPLFIHGFGINDFMCGGYGFKVTDCSGFELKPNSSRRINISFTPDFTMSRIQRSLLLYTTIGNPINYTLQATIPAHLLTKCSSALPRATWEPILYYTIVCLMGFFLFFVLVAAYFESDRIFTADIVKRSRQMFETHLTPKGKPFMETLSNVFDFRKITGLSRTIEVDTKSKPPDTNGHIPKLPSSANNNVSSQSRPYSRQTSSNDAANINAKPPLVRQNSKKSKAGKRNPSVTTPTETTFSISTDIPLDHNFESLLEKTSIASLEMKKYCGDTNKSLDTSLDNNPINSIDDVICNVPPKQQVKIKQSKWKNKLSQKQLDQKQADEAKKQTANIFLDDKDETSSSTTESSCLDPDEKNSGSARDSTPEPLLDKPKRKLKKSARENSPDNTFTLNTQKTQHRGKNKHIHNMHEPVEWDLPYTLKKVKEPTPSRSLTTNNKDRAFGKKKTGKPTGLKINTNGDLDEFSLATAQFAARQHKYGLNEPLTSSSRSNSYSSVVSSSSSDGNHGSNRKSGFSPVDEHKAKQSKIPQAPKSLAINGGHKWSLSSGSPTTPCINTSMAPGSFSLQPIDETSVNHPMMMNRYGQPPGQPYHNTPPPAGSNVPEVTPGQTYGNAVYPSHTTMMQGLQADRRRRQMEYQQKVLRGDEWPGFGMEHVHNNSLWDSSPSWSQPVQQPEERQLWGGINISPSDTSTPDSSATWNSLASIWKPSAGNQPRNSPEQTSENQLKQQECGSFDPWADNVQPLDDLWGSPGSPNTGWASFQGARQGKNEE